LYYTSRIDDYEPMLNDILKTLQEERAAFAKIRGKRDSIRNDSLKNARIKQNLKTTHKNLKTTKDSKKSKSLDTRSVDE